MPYFIISVLLVGIFNIIWAPSGNANTGQELKKTSELCASLVRIYEHRHGIPLYLLSAISQAESGRWNSESQANLAWPWTVTSGGSGKFFDTKLEAVAEVEFLMTNGVRNIDVGCMQINLAAHSNAFETIEQAFNPVTNVAYGASYLKTMHQRTGDWLKAAGGYHSMTPHISRRYIAKISRIWNQLLGSQARHREPVKTQPINNFVRPYYATTTGDMHLNNLNRNFRQRLNLSAKAVNSDPITRRLNTRLKQMSAWRKAQSRGENLSVLADMRESEQAKRRKRELATLRKGNRHVSFAERRRQQLDTWRVQQTRELPVN